MFDLAIFFHDAIYETDHTDNEARSADLLATHAGPADGSERLLPVGTMIRATATHMPSRDPATRLMLDLDLAVLGAHRRPTQPTKRRSGGNTPQSRRPCGASAARAYSAGSSPVHAFIKRITSTVVLTLPRRSILRRR